MPVAHTHPLLRGIAALLVLGGLGSATAACGSGPTTTEASASAPSAGAHLGADEFATAIHQDGVVIAAGGEVVRG